VSHSSCNIKPRIKLQQIKSYKNYSPAASGTSAALELGTTTSAGLGATSIGEPSAAGGPGDAKA
jgi:hypothetical protein